MLTRMVIITMTTANTMTVTLVKYKEVTKAIMKSIILPPNTTLTSPVTRSTIKPITIRLHSGTARVPMLMVALTRVVEASTTMIRAIMERVFIMTNLMEIMVMDMLVMDPMVKVTEQVIATRIMILIPLMELTSSPIMATRTMPNRDITTSMLLMELVQATNKSLELTIVKSMPRIMKIIITVRHITRGARTVNSTRPTPTMLIRDMETMIMPMVTTTTTHMMPRRDTIPMLTMAMVVMEVITVILTMELHPTTGTMLITPTRPPATTTIMEITLTNMELTTILIKMPRMSM